MNDNTGETFTASSPPPLNQVHRRVGRAAPWNIPSALQGGDAMLNRRKKPDFGAWQQHCAPTPAR